MAIWTYYITNDLKPELLDGMLGANAASNGAESVSADSDKKLENGAPASADVSEENSNLSSTADEDSNPAPSSNPTQANADAPKDTNGADKNGTSKDPMPPEVNGEQDSCSNGSTPLPASEQNGAKTNGAESVSFNSNIWHIKDAMKVQSQSTSSSLPHKQFCFYLINEKE